MKRLSELKSGQAGVVHLIEFSEDQDVNDISIRLRQLGILENEMIKVVRKSPLNDSTFLIEARGAQFALTKNEAKIVLVKLEKSHE